MNEFIQVKNVVYLVLHSIPDLPLVFFDKTSSNSGKEVLIINKKIIIETLILLKSNILIRERERGFRDLGNYKLNG